jgi:hypothetical protein
MNIIKVRVMGFKPAVTDSIEKAIPIAFVHLPIECKPEHRDLSATLAVLRLQQQVVEMCQGFTIRMEKGSGHGTVFFKNGRKQVLQSPVYILKGLMDEGKARLVAKNLGKPFEQLSFASADEIMELIRREDVDALLIYEQIFLPGVQNQGALLESYKLFNASGKEIAIATALTRQENIEMDRTTKKRIIICAGSWPATIGVLIYSYLDMTGGPMMGA